MNGYLTRIIKFNFFLVIIKFNLNLTYKQLVTKACQSKNYFYIYIKGVPRHIIKQNPSFFFYSLSYFFGSKTSYFFGQQLVFFCQRETSSIGNGPSPEEPIKGNLAKRKPSQLKQAPSTISFFLFVVC